METTEFRENRRKRSQTFSYFLVLIVSGLFLSILASLVWGKLTDIEETAMISWGGVLVGAMGIAINYEWGSSKGSETSKDMAQQAQSGKTTTTTLDAKEGTATTETKP